MRLLVTAVLAIARLSGQDSAQELMDAGHYRRATGLVEARLRANPSDPDALCLMAGLKQEAGDLAGAEARAEKALAIKQTAACHFRLAEVYGEMAQNAGVLHQVSLGLKFKKEADAALALDPNLVGALKDEMVFYLHAPGIAGGDKGKASAMAERIMKIDPVEGYFARIDLAMEEKREGETEGLLRKAVEAGPESFAARLQLANFCANHNKPEEAERLAREAIRLHPDRATGYGALAVTLVRQSKWPELETALTEGERAVPDNLLPYYRAANTCLAQKRELARAEQYFRKYLTQTPELTMPPLWNVHWRLGLVLEQLGRKNEAIAELRTSVKIDSKPRVNEDLKRLLR